MKINKYNETNTDNVYYEGDITYRTNDFSQVIDQIFERNSAWGGMSKEAMELFMKFCEEE